MQFLSILSVVLLGAILALSVETAPKGREGNSLLSCYTVILGLFAIYFFMPAALLILLQGAEYVWLPAYGGHSAIFLTSLVCTAALALFLAAYAFRSRISPARSAVGIPARPTPTATQVAWVLVGTGVALKLYVIFGAGGLELTVSRLSGGIRSNLQLGNLEAFLVMLRFASGVADAAITWLLIQHMHLRRPFYTLLVVFILVIALSFIGTGKRLYVLWPMVALGLGIHFYVRPLRTSLLPAAALLVMGAGFLTLMFRIYAPAGLNDVQIDLVDVPWADGSLFRFYFFSGEFVSFEVLSMVIYNSEAIVRQFGGAFPAFLTTNIEPFAYFIPRELWAGKPEILLDLSHANRVLMVGGGLSEGGGVASTLLGTSWTIGGPIGLTVAMLLLGWISAAADGGAEIRGVPTPRGLIVYAFVMVALFHLFRQGTLAWTAIIVVLQQLGVIVGFLLLFSIDRKRKVRILRKRRRKRRPRDPVMVTKGAAHAKG